MQIYLFLSRNGLIERLLNGELTADISGSCTVKMFTAMLGSKLSKCKMFGKASLNFSIKKLMGA
eukprot:m.17350 g.17350  ORF g.17350 m.17350 type:complete len:64 (+) comp5996_c0_seq1:73-264(+)